MIYIGSLHYSPIYKSHCCAQGKELENEGYEIRYLFNYNYEWMLPDDIKEKTTFIGNSKDIKSLISDLFNQNNSEIVNNTFLKDKPNYVYLHNIHPFLNNSIAKLTKKHSGKFIQHIHEPFVDNKNVYGGIQRYWLYLFEYMQQKLLDNSDIAVLSSDEAFSLFSKRYSNFRGKKVRIPLMYEDLGNEMINSTNRKYITFIGPPVPAKGPEKLLDVVRFSIDHEMDYKFVLISHSPVVEKKYQDFENMEIFHKDRISDEEVGYFQKNSFMAFTPYKTARQSSVVLTSNMYGTPALATNIKGLNEFISHEETGYLLETTANTEEWIEGMNFIRNNFEKMSGSCRKYFVENFSEKNWPKYFDEIFI